jgi:hypothetical protein
LKTCSDIFERAFGLFRMDQDPIDDMLLLISTLAQKRAQSLLSSVQKLIQIEILCQNIYVRDGNKLTSRGCRRFHRIALFFARFCHNNPPQERISCTSLLTHPNYHRDLEHCSNIRETDYCVSCIFFLILIQCVELKR